MGTSFGCVDIDIGCKNISISFDVKGGRGGGNIFFSKVQIHDTKKLLF